MKRVYLFFNICVKRKVVAVVFLRLGALREPPALAAVEVGEKLLGISVRVHPRYKRLVAAVDKLVVNGLAACEKYLFVARDLAEQLVKAVADGDFQNKEMEMLLNQLPTACLGRIVLHDCFELNSRYPLRGIHLSSRHSEPPTGFCGGLSCSCHTLQEISERKQHFHYLFLSPIFDSISKKGYSSAFPTNVLEEAHRRHIIDQRVVALGGITLDKIATVRKLGFGGVALLGDIWQQAPEQFLPHFQALRREVLR